MSKAIKYIPRQVIGEYGLIYIKEVALYVNPNNRKITRQAEFECPHCKEHKHFISQICNAKNGHTTSCGCLQQQARIQTINKYNEQHLSSWNKEYHKTGNIIGSYGVIFVKDYPIGTKRSTKGYPYRYSQFCCPVCGKMFDAIFQNVKKNLTKGCGLHISYGEEQIAQILTQLNISFQRQKTFIDLKSKKNYPLKFDFYLPDYNLCIEYDGEFHFKDKIENFYWNTKQNYLKTVERDELKNQYCIEHNINLIRIPYTELQKLNSQNILNILRGEKSEICFNTIYGHF